MVEPQLPKLMMGVQFPSPAPAFPLVMNVAEHVTRNSI